MRIISKRFRVAAKLLFFPNLRFIRAELVDDVPGLENSTLWMAIFSVVFTVSVQLVPPRSIDIGGILTGSLFFPFLIFIWLRVIDLTIRKVWRSKAAEYENLLFVISTLYVVFVVLTIIFFTLIFIFPHIPESTYNWITLYVLFLSILSIRYVTGLGIIRSIISFLISSLLSLPIAVAGIYTFTRILFGLKELH